MAGSCSAVSVRAPEVENKFYLLVVLVEPREELLPVHVFAQLFARDVGQLFLNGEVINHHNVVEIGGVEAGYQAAGDEASGSGYNYHERKFYLMLGTGRIC